MSEELIWPALENGSIDVYGLTPAHVNRLTLGPSVTSGSHSSAMPTPELRSPSTHGIDLISNSLPGVQSELHMEFHRCHLVPRGPTELQHTAARMSIILYTTGLFRAAAASLPVDTVVSAATEDSLREVVRWVAKHALRRAPNLVVMMPSFHAELDSGRLFIFPTTAALRTLIAYYLASLRVVEESNDSDALSQWRPAYDLATVQRREPTTSSGTTFPEDPLLFRRVEVFSLMPCRAPQAWARLHDPADVTQGSDVPALGSYHKGERLLPETTHLLFLAVRAALAPRSDEHPPWTAEDGPAQEEERGLWAALTEGCEILLDLLTAGNLPGIAALSQVLAQAEAYVWPPLQAAGERRRRTTTSSSSSSDPDLVVPARFEAFRKWVLLEAIMQRAGQEALAGGGLAAQVETARAHAMSLLEDSESQVCAQQGRLLWQKVPMDFWRAVFPAPVDEEGEDD
ncbi:unnamed protein product [Parajaminaea phylloscopi]